ncbi:putative Na+/H+ antiporter [Uliginosibacterium sp. sgz301328]|uniref:putative Na+/H+ antiporter n=1 Tax=Uliginosibacterium sp. sgz301328 TaxID=3243764 RepID=UPI00359D904D
MSHALEITATFIFALAVLHTFIAPWFERRAHRDTANAGMWHLFGEVEAVFGIWAAVLLLIIAIAEGAQPAIDYLESRNFTEPMFVFAIMVIAASKPILQLCVAAVRSVVRVLPLPETVAFYSVVLAVVPLLGSFITEPAAMTLAALMLRDRFYTNKIPTSMRYATIGVLFVNVSIGGTLTSYAAPPVLMVAGKWGWDTAFMFTHFGWKAMTAVLVNTIGVTALFWRHLRALDAVAVPWNRESPLPVIGFHLLCLIGVVMFSHHAAVFMMIFLIFLGFAEAYRAFQDRLILREGLMVALFLAGLVILGGMQKWWLQELLAGMDNLTLYFGATALTAITDNAALTYLGSLVQGTDDAFKYALVAGAVTGGGLTVIANAPNPAGYSILKRYFPNETISPVLLFLSAALPTVVAICAFLLL